MIFALIITGLTLILCIFTDNKKARVWPLLCGILFILASFEPGKDVGLSVLSAIFGYAPTFIVSSREEYGWLDAFLLGALGYALPFMFSIYFFLASSLYYMIGLCVMETQEFPFIPFICAGWLTTLIIYLLGGIIV